MQPLTKVGYLFRRYDKAFGLTGKMTIEIVRILDMKYLSKHQLRQSGLKQTTNAMYWPVNGTTHIQVIPLPFIKILIYTTPFLLSLCMVMVVISGAENVKKNC
jgi:hypothetical protein